MNASSSSMLMLIQEACNHYDWAVSCFPSYFQNGLNSVFPIVWFGELSSDDLKVITFGCNPSDKEFVSNGSTRCSPSRFPKSFGHISIKNLLDDYELYFHNNPYYKWFNPIQSFSQQYFGVPPKNCIHIDGLPFATSVKYTRLKNVLSSRPTPIFNCFNDVLCWGSGFTRRLTTEIIQRDSILGVSVVGKTCSRVFFEVFNRHISNIRTGRFKVGKRSFGIWRCDLSLSGKKTEVIGTSIYLPNSHGFRQNDIPQLISSIKKL